jgi:predicted Zn-dependent peptidase
VLARIDAITPEDVLSVCREFFAPESQTVVSLGPGE